MSILISNSRYIRPKQVLSITDNGCLTPGEEYTFAIQSLETGPNPIGYIWLLDNDTIHGYDGNFATFKAQTKYHSISIISKGKDGYNSERATFELSYTPETPLDIIKPTECIASNMPDELIFSVSPVYSGNTYHWTITNGVILDSNDTSDSSSIRVRTYGVPESDVILEVNAYNECGSSGSKKDSVFIPRTQYSINYTEQIEGTEYDYGEFSVGGKNLTKSTADFEWYFLDNGIPVEDVLYDEGDKYAYYADNQALYMYGDISNSNRYTVVCIITIKSTKCQYRKTYGANLASNYVIPQSSPSGTSPKRTIHEKQVSRFAAFPNPTKTTLNLESADSTKFSYYIYSLDGHLITSQIEAQSDKYTVDTSSFPNGVYEVIYVHHNRKHSGKFIKE